MNDLISRDKLRKEILDKFPQGSARGVFLAFVDEQPTVEPVRGAWIVKEDENCFATWDYCSICGFSTGFAGSSHYINFCPNCGARMSDM